MKRYLIFFAALTLVQLALPGAINAKVTDYPLQSKYPNIMLYQGEVPKKVIALTFDDGPDERYTPKVLDVLKKYHVKATFFLLGSRVKKYPNVAKRIVKEGHVIGNHTYWHPQLTKTGKDNMKWEIKKTEKEIEHATGHRTSLFRAPYGALNDNLVKEIGDMGYKGIGWSIDTNDWRELPTKKIISNVMNYAHPGAITLMHSAGHWTLDLSGTVQALEKIIPRLRKEGYEFVTIPEMWDISHPQPYK